MTNPPGKPKDRSKPTRFSSFDSSFAQTIIDAISFPVVILDSNHTVHLLNESTVKNFSVAPGNIIGNKCSFFCPDEVCVRCPLDKASAQLSPQESEYFDQESKRWLHAFVFPLSFLTDEGLHLFLLVVTDVTDRKNIERERDVSIRRHELLANGTIQIMQTIISERDPYQGEHQQEVSRLAVAIAEEMGLNPHLIEGLRIAALIHDLGKIGVPAEILMRSGPLVPLEYELIKGHPQKGYDILKNIPFPFPLAEIVYQHHERLNGSGYPRGLRASDILIESKILAVAEVVEAMSATRPYRPAWSIDATLKHIEENRGVFFDPATVDACVRLIRKKGYCLRKEG